MLSDSNKNIGNSSLAIAISYFVCNGYTVSIPLNDTQDYDLVVEKDSKLYRVQVKGTTFKTKFGVYQVALKVVVEQKENSIKLYVIQMLNCYL